MGLLHVLGSGFPAKRGAYLRIRRSEIQRLFARWRPAADANPNQYPILVWGFQREEPVPASVLQNRRYTIRFSSRLFSPANTSNPKRQKKARVPKGARGPCGFWCLRRTLLAVSRGGREARGQNQRAYAWARAWSRSAIMSSAFSMPTERRMRSSERWAALSCSAVSWECVVEAGWMMRDLASPTLARCVKSFTLSTTFRPASRPPLTPKTTTPPKPFLRTRDAVSWLGSFSRPE